MELFVVNFLNGISFGAIVFLVAAGLSLIFGVMGILNLAHGALYMIGAYVGWTIARDLGANYVLGVLGGAAAAGITGLILERGFLRNLHKQLNEQVLLTFGAIYVIQNGMQWIWGASPKGQFTASALSGTFPIMTGVNYSIARVVVIFIGIAIAVFLWWLMEKTRVGAIIRAGVDNKEMTVALGINYVLVSTLVFTLGSFIAGGAGVIGAQLFGINLSLALDILLLAMVVVVVGGTGSVPGALLGAVIIGLIISFGKALFPDLAMFFIYFVMVIVLLVKPSGIMGRKV